MLDVTGTLRGNAAEAFANARLPLASLDASHRIVIVGAGIAGLSTALTLALNGVDSTIYECSTRVGGRIHSNTGDYWTDGQISEWCGELIDTDHEAIRALAARFGLVLTDMIASEPSGSEATYFFRGARYSREHANADFRRVYDALQRDLEAAGQETTWSTHTPGGVKLDSLSVRQWIATRVPGGHSSAMGRLLDVAYTAQCAAETADQSALNIVYSLGVKSNAHRFSLFGDSDERYHIHGGNEQLPQRMADALPSAIRFGWRLETVAVRPGGSVSLLFDVGGSSAEVVADHVVLAVPFAALRSVDCDEAGFDEIKRAAISGLGVGRSAKLTLQFMERYWCGRDRSKTSNGSSFADTGYMSTWESTRGEVGSAGILVNYTGGDAAGSFAAATPYGDTNSEPRISSYARRFLQQIAPVFPDLPERWNGKATLSVPMLDPAVRGSYPYYRVGQWYAFRHYERVRAGNVHFAGDHCSPELQGYMEGAATEGYRAACEILSDIAPYRAVGGGPHGSHA